MTGETGLRSRMERGEAVLSAWSGLPDSLTVEAVAGLPFDAVTLDMQHGAHHEDSVARGLAAVIAAGRNALVRIPVGRFDMASRALDFGAEAVIAPMVNSVGDAQAFAAAMKYPPVGKRSWGPSLAMPRRQTRDPAAWLAGANIATMAFAMIETREAFAAVDSILAVPGIDGVFVGPSDLSIALTKGAVVDANHPEVDKALDHIGARCKAKGKVAGAFCMTGKRAKEVAAKGFRLCSISTDGVMMRLGARLELKAARG